MNIHLYLFGLTFVFHQRQIKQQQPEVAQHPNARPGYLCVFERFSSTNAGHLSVCDSFNECPSADPWGATVGALVTDPGLFGIDGTWAVRRGHARAR